MLYSSTKSHNGKVDKVVTEIHCNVILDSGGVSVGTTVILDSRAVEFEASPNQPDCFQWSCCSSFACMSHLVVPGACALQNPALQSKKGLVSYFYSSRK